MTNNLSIPGAPQGDPQQQQPSAPVGIQTRVGGGTTRATFGATEGVQEMSIARVAARNGWI